MPNNKKKNKGCGAKKKKKATTAPQAVGDVDLGDLSLLDSYPQRETPTQSLQRILQYKYLSDKDGRPLCIKLDEEDEEGGDKYVIEYLDVNRRFAVNKAYLHQMIASGLLPDYDRKAANYPIAMELMDRKPKDLSRRALKCIDSVPAGKRDVFKKFVARGEGMSVECAKTPYGDGATTYYYKVILLDCEDEEFIINASPTQHGVGFQGSLISRCPEKYHKELSLLLMHECMTRIVAGTANINRDLAAIDERLVATPNELVNSLATVIRSTCVDMRRWGDLIRLEIFLLEWAVKNESSLHKAAGIAEKLGESLEAKGYQSRAAAVYTEAAEHLLAAKHPGTSTFFCNAGLAWKRDKEFEKGETSYAAALETLHLQYDPKQYHNGLFNCLNNLWMCWEDTENPNCPVDLVSTLRALIIAAGEPSPSPGGDHLYRTNVPYLRQDLRANAKRVRSVLASIARESTSVEALRAAMRKCANPNIKQTITSIFTNPNADNRDSRTVIKEHAREQLFTGDRMLLTCEECGELKEEKALKRCGACNRVCYCDEKCQKANWKEHKVDCKAWCNENK